jgi:GGDEF domain-containing protein
MRWLFDRLWPGRRALRNAAARRAFELASQGRRSAIYERDTGLYAFWYLQLRTEEELVRAERIGHNLACVSIWIDEPDRLQRLVASAQACVRRYDMAAYLDNGHVVLVLLDETPIHAQVVMNRIAVVMGGGMTAGISTYPEDGTTFGELLERAKARAATIDLAA